MAQNVHVADSRPLETTNRPDEWKIEQGLHGAKIPFLDQSGDITVEILPRQWPKEWKDDEAIKAVGNRDELFAAERDGWKGYVEWEKYPEKKAKAHKILTSQNFPPNPEFQLGPMPGTNPVLPGTHWKMWHTAIGGELSTVAEDSWATVLREKHPEMLHLLQFPYNGEPPKRLTTAKPLSVRAAWNWGLHVKSSAHRVKVYSINKKRPLTAHKLELSEKTGSPLAPITWPEEFVTQGWDEYKRFWAEHEPRDVDD